MSTRKQDEGPDLFDEVLRALAQAAWRYRDELGALGALGLLTYWATNALGVLGGSVLVGSCLGVVVTWGPSRRWVFEHLARAHWRRRLERALEHLAPRFGGRAPGVAAVRRCALGATARVRLRPGQAPKDFEAAAEALSAALRVGEVRVERERDDAGILALTAVVRDPLGTGALACPWAGGQAMSLFDEVAIGRDEHGQQVGLELFGHNLLAGGEPGSAKSNLLHLVAAATALDPQASLWILDPKVVEFRLRYQGVAAAVAGDDIAEANAVLERLSEEMAARYRLLEARGKRKVSPGDGLHVLVVDEVMLYLHDPDKRAAARFATLLRSLVALGRAAGIIVAIATQKPSAEVIPSAIRDLVTYRAAFRCTTKEASDTILGSGWAAQGASASEIDAGQPGVCYLLAEGARPVKVRCYHLEDDAIDVMVSAARRWGR